MPTTDPAKNVEYFKRSQAKKKEVLGETEYNRINADAEQRHRDKLKAKQEKMNIIDNKQRQLKKDVGKVQKVISTLTDAIKAKKKTIIIIISD